MISEATCTVCYYEGGVADGAMEVVGGDGGGRGRGGDVDDGGASPPVVIFVPDDVVAFDVRGFIVTGIPHIFDSVVLTGLSFDNGLLGLHIASFCCGVNVTFPTVTFPCVWFPWPCALPKVPNTVSIITAEASMVIAVKLL
jgi:hypothetical protein